MTPKQEAALRLAREALQYVYEGANNQGPHTGISWRCASNKIEPVIAAIDEVLSDNALDKMAENARELGLDYEPAQKDYKAFYDGKKWYSVEVEPPCKTGSQCTSKCQQCEQPAKEQKLEFVSPGGGYVPAIPRPIPLDWKLVPRKATPEMLRAMDECAQEGYDERLYEGMASSVYMAAWDASPVLGTLPPSEKERSMMDIIVGNLVREGINKHRARELAEHFVKHISAPQSKPWVGLTQQDINIAFDDTQEGGGFDDFAHAIEAKLREKNAQPSKPLTDEQIILIVAECAASHQHTDIHFARAIERAHGIKGLV